MKKVFEIKARVVAFATLYVAAENKNQAEIIARNGEASRVDFDNDTARAEDIQSIEEVE